MGAAHEELQQSRIRIDSLSAQLSQLQKQVLPPPPPSASLTSRPLPTGEGAEYAPRSIDWVKSPGFGVT